LNAQLKQLEEAPVLTKSRLLLETEILAESSAIDDLKKIMAENKKNRNEKRAEAKSLFSDVDFQQINKELSKDSVKDKIQLRDLKLLWLERITCEQSALDKLLNEIQEIKTNRKTLSVNLQNKIFAQYQFLNCKGETKDLIDIFNSTAYYALHHKPPAGSGDCAAPKLLQYAFQQQMKPLALAEFWWGKPPKSEVRQHKNFYTACIGKCQPILGHMLAGMALDENLLLKNSGQDKVVEILYQDDVMAIINKPNEFLSVPGKNIDDCVHLQMKQHFPNATGPLIVHRLDMSTSGLMVISLTKESHKNLQQQFINRTVEKRYLALLSGILKKDEGHISLPLCGDYDDRPRQLVSFDYGKPAETNWQVIKRYKNYTKVYLSPKTGRTHQLRVHCAHVQGLNMPIVGDDLYGKKDNRLHLHAQMLKINHPITNERLHFEVGTDF